MITYNAIGQKIAMADPDMGLWRYRYDAAGNLISQTNALTTTLFSYDGLNRLVGKDYGGNGSTDVTYTYDSMAGGNLGKGYRARMDDPSGWTPWKYDARGRVISQTQRIDGVDYTTQWTYNARDQVVTQTYPDGETVRTAYGMWGQPATLTSTLGITYVVKAMPTDAFQIDYMKLGGTEANPVSYTHLTLPTIYSV